MTMTEIMQCFPELKPGETPPDYVHRLHQQGVDEKMLRNMKISKMVALNKGITLPRSMTLWDVKKVKSPSLGKDSLDELKQKCAEEVIQGKSTLCLAIASLEEAGATDLQMEDFLIQLPGGEGLAVVWRTGNLTLKARAAKEWELKRQFREERKTKNAKTGNPSAQAKGGQSSGQDRTGPALSQGREWTQNRPPRDPPSRPSLIYQTQDRQDNRRSMHQPRNDQGQFTPRRNQDQISTEQGTMNGRDSGDRRQSRSTSNPQGRSQTQGDWRSRGPPSGVANTFMGRRIKEGAPPPPPFVPREEFLAMNKVDRDRVNRTRDEYSRKWLI